MGCHRLSNLWIRRKYLWQRLTILNYYATTAMDNNWNWSITASGTASMAAINTTTIRDIVSYYWGVNPERNSVLSNTET